MNQIEEAARLMEEAIDRICNDLPTKIDDRVAKNINNTVKRIKENREKRKTQKIPEGRYFADPFSKSTYLKDLRDLLLIFKKVVIPMKINEEVFKLKSISLMARQIDNIDQDELNADLKKAALIGKDHIEAIQQMAKIIGNLANG